MIVPASFALPSLPKPLALDVGMLDPEMLQRLARAMAAAAELALTVLLGVGLGAWLDSRLGTAPILILLLALAGLVIALVRLTRWMKTTETPDDSDPS